MKASPSINLVTPGLVFDEAAHIYTLAGARVPGVTRILRARNLIDDTWFTEEACARGKAVHEAIHLLAENDLDLASVDPRIDGYLDAHRKFVFETELTIFASEIGMGSRAGFAGTADMLAWMGGVMTLIDIKSGAPDRWHELQLAAYSMLIKENAAALGLSVEDLPRDFMTVQLKDDGKYVIHTLKDPVFANIKWFQSALALTLWCDDWRQ